MGERKVLRAAEGDWRAPERGTALDNAWRAACESDFRGPFASSTLKVAQETAPPPATPTPAPARAPETAQQPGPPRPPAAPPPVATASAHGTAARPAAGLVAQVGATTSEPEARRLLASLGGQVDGRDTWVETAVVAGRTWRRAVVGGFADAGEANRFCAAMKAAKRDCFVRPAAAK
ncbi:SPOR domain-containing protein [Nostoc sp. NIES-2111]